MTDKAPTVEAKIRGSRILGREGALTYAGVRIGTGLLLTREPTNPVDPNAIIVSTEEQAIGYVGREWARQVAPWIDKGWVYTGVVIRECTRQHVRNRIRVWEDMVARLVPIAPIAISRTSIRKRELELETS